MLMGNFFLSKGFNLLTSSNHGLGTVSIGLLDTLFTFRLNISLTW